RGERRGYHAGVDEQRSSGDDAIHPRLVEDEHLGWRMDRDARAFVEDEVALGRGVLGVRPLRAAAGRETRGAVVGVGEEIAVDDGLRADELREAGRCALALIRLRRA